MLPVNWRVIVPPWPPHSCFCRWLLSSRVCSIRNGVAATQPTYCLALLHGQYGWKRFGMPGIVCSTMLPCNPGSQTYTPHFASTDTANRKRGSRPAASAVLTPTSPSGSSATFTAISEPLTVTPAGRNCVRYLIRDQATARGIIARMIANRNGSTE